DVCSSDLSTAHPELGRNDRRRSPGTAELSTHFLVPGCRHVRHRVVDQLHRRAGPQAVRGEGEQPVNAELLVADDVVVRFHTGKGVVHAVDGVSLRMRAGEVLAVVVESGSRKTVFVRRLMGLIAGDRSTEVSGSVTFDGTVLTELTGRQLSRIWGAEIAMVLQDPMTSLNPVKRIGDQLTETMLVHERISSSAARARAVELLRSVGLSEPQRRVRQYPHELSGGMRQRVTIAIALACGPRLLLADEPTTALDVTVQAQILDLLAGMQQRTGMAMMLVTHDLRVVRSRSDRVAVMYAGTIVEEAPT